MPRLQILGLVIIICSVLVLGIQLGPLANGEITLAEYFKATWPSLIPLAIGISIISGKFKKS
jgi:hypothetical protein